MELQINEHSNEINIDSNIDVDINTNSIFNAYIKPEGIILSNKIEELTGITQDYLNDEGMTFQEAWGRFQMWMTENNSNNQIVLLAHNGRNFDFNFLEAELLRIGNTSLNNHCTCLLDTLEILRDDALWMNDQRPTSFALGNLYRHVKSRDIENSHNAMFDVLALAEILESNNIKKRWKQVAHGKQFSI